MKIENVSKYIKTSQRIFKMLFSKEIDEINIWCKF